MTVKRKDLETLRLLRAFVKITNPEKRREIIALVEKSRYLRLTNNLLVDQPACRCPTPTKTAA